MLRASRSRLLSRGGPSDGAVGKALGSRFWSWAGGGQAKDARQAFEFASPRGEGLLSGGFAAAACPATNNLARGCPSAAPQAGFFRSFVATAGFPRASDASATHATAEFRRLRPLGFLRGKSTSAPGSGSGSTSASASSTTAGAPPSGILSWYLGFLESHPVITKAITAGSIFTGADITSQYLTYQLQETVADGSALVESGVAGTGQDGNSPAGTQSTAKEAWAWDAYRTMRMGAAGLILSGPTLHVWFGLMARWRPGRDLGSIVQKIVAGTVLYGPVFNAVFFSSNGALQGEGKKEIMGRLKRDLLPTLVNGLMYWPFCDLLTYRFVPVHLQPLANNSAAYLWTIYVTYMAGQAPPVIASE